MDTKKQKYSVFFCGISKNCVETISSNLKFLDSFFIHSEFNSFGVFVDSDSTDGSKTLSFASAGITTGKAIAMAIVFG